MLALHPLPETDHACPACNSPLHVEGWYMPGMRSLADLKCPECNKTFYGDLLSGQALKTPMLIERATGIVYDKYHAPWFARLLEESYQNRINKPLSFEVKTYKKVKNPILLNCLDVLYGHCLLKLLNAQHYIDKFPNMDLIVIVPPFLLWLIPDGIAEAWILDIPLSDGAQWNDWVALEIKTRIEKMENAFLSVALPHPHPEDYEIERFSRISPFPLDQWKERLKNPVVTFIWRDDRTWIDSRDENTFPNFFKKSSSKKSLLEKQEKQVAQLASLLKAVYPELDFSVVGMGNAGNLPKWISDMRVNEITDKEEKQWCKLYAKSIAVIGVHGSNMLLPSAHSGSVVELMPHDRWGNILQDILFSREDCREKMYRNRFVPLSTSPQELAVCVLSLLRDHGSMMINLGAAYCRHDGEDYKNYPSVRASLISEEDS